MRLTTHNLSLLGAASVALLVGVAASAQSTAPDPASALVPPQSDDIATFYTTYKPQPIWTRNGINEAATAQLVTILQR
ncbi:MAG: hypothetical protein QOF05_1183, partial [Sphingomonadales bacterium]|nr:hypothetical protein [Sphingomonadales bacterium]